MRSDARICLSQCQAFAVARSIALLFLGTPPTLQLADAGISRAELAASNIGPPILKIPGRHAISYMQ